MNPMFLIFPHDGQPVVISGDVFEDRSEHVVLETFGSVVLAHSGRHGDTGSPVTGWAQS